MSLIIAMPGENRTPYRLVRSGNLLFIIILFIISLK